MDDRKHQGDEGYTGILGEGRVRKNDPRIELVGALDEVSSALGMACASGISPGTAERLRQVQRDLYGMMSEVSAGGENAARFRAVGPGRVQWLDQLADEYSQAIQIPKDFILPGDTFPGAVLDFARTVIRRAERRMAEVAFAGGIENPDLLRYLNRLSLVCFYLELFEVQAGGKSNPTLVKPDFS